MLGLGNGYNLGRFLSLYKATCSFKRQICGNIKMAFFFKWSYSKVRAFLPTSAGSGIFS